MRRAAPLAAVVLACGGLLAPSPAAAHAFGPFSISVYSRLVVTKDQIEIRWVLDMAEIPSTATVELIDANADGTVTAREKGEYFDLWVGSVLGQIELVVDGQDLPKEIVGRELTLPEGEGGSPYLRVEMDLVAEVPGEGASHSATYRDSNYIDYVGWREVAVAPGNGAQLIESSAPLEGRTNELTVYPADLGRSVPTSEAEFVFAAAGLAPSVPAGQPVLPGQPEPEPSGGFQIWPTGVLAALAVIGLAAIMLAANRPSARPRR
jgi:nickel/cobalt exporter